jgi:small subunit ribosomal protein S25e
MGGSKNKSPAQKQKSQQDESSKKSGEKKKGQKKDKSEGGSSKAEITVLVNEEQAMKFIKNSKVITIQALARHLGVKISASNAFLKKLSKDGTVKKVGGFSGHHIYATVSA